MSQYDYATIDPNAKSGTQLAIDLNNWRDALHSGHRGAARPPYAQGGMQWVRETSAEQWDLMFYDGDTDFVLRSVNPTTNQLIGIPQSAVSGLSEIATATAELGGKADDLETKAGELETKAGELESGLANLAGRTSALESIGKPLTKEYVADNISWTAGTTITLNHNFGTPPKSVEAYLVMTAAFNGLSIGNVVRTQGSLMYAGASSWGIEPRNMEDINSLSLIVGSHGFLTGNPAGGGASVNNSQCKLRLRVLG